MVLAFTGHRPEKLPWGSDETDPRCAALKQQLLEAVGTAAALAIQHGCTPKEIGNAHIKELQQTLIKDDCYVPGFKNEDEKDLARACHIEASSHTEGNIPENIVSGITRAMGDNSHVWESQAISDTPQWLSLSLDKPSNLSQIRIVFDPDLNAEIMVTQTKRQQDKMIKDMPSSLVKDYSLVLYKDGKEVFRKNVKDNVERLAVTELEDISADRVALEISSTYGMNKARVFEIRLYESI